MRKPRRLPTHHACAGTRSAGQSVGTCPSEDAIDEYVLNRLPQPEKTAFESHLKTCRNCARNLLFTKALVQALQDEKRAGFEAAP